MLPAVRFVRCVGSGRSVFRVISDPMGPTDLLQRVVEALANQFPSRSGLNPRNLAGAASFIEKEFNAIAFSVESQYYEASGVPVRNIIAQQAGRDPSLSSIILGAHYDTVVGTPGADDNASGVAALLELAQRLKEYANRRTLRYVAFTHEEPPYFYTFKMGSRRYAKQLKRDREKVALMISLEMLGYGNPEYDQSYPFLFLRQLGRYPKEGNFIALVSNLRSARLMTIVKRAMRQVCSIRVESLAAPGFLPPLFLSDHSSFWKYGFPALMVTDTAFLRNPHYHLPSDKPETLNYAFLAEAVKGIEAAVRALDQSA